ncbi:ABC transporter permease subunit [Brevibacillus fluminis]|uniref:ABC transporter permease subunit n=1 Tax=Brevibacillus fluminis TaxID=511487 RepID=A0A3M8D993_9BACL|nr:ABC transporter permease subunit [Brevibacillus fluminis]RNB84463.1 ABC transporter permease subunit [Brevibacillus fluminis]
MRWKTRNQMLYLFLLPFLFVTVAFMLLPLIAMVISSFTADGGGAWTLSQYATALTNKFYLVALKNSIFISFFSSIAGILIALFAAYSITRFSAKSREFILMLSNMTSNFAGVPLAFAYMILLGSNGLFTLLFKQWGWDVFASFDLYSWTGLAFVYFYFQLPLAILMLYPTYFGIHQQWRESATLLGASTFQFWRSIGIPVVLPGIAGTFSILFANAMGAYATAYALVGSNYNLLAIRIGTMVSGDIYVKPELAGALAVILAIIMVVAIWFNETMMRRVRRDLQ